MAGVHDQDGKHWYKRKDKGHSLPQKERGFGYLDSGSRFIAIMTLEFELRIPISLRDIVRAQTS